MKNFLKIISIILVCIILITVITVNITPNPIVSLARSLLFGGLPESSTLPGYENMQNSVEIVKDKNYPSEFPNNSFDVYLPKNAKSDDKYPTIFWVHGGGFIGGDKAMIENYGVSLASEGFVVVALNYSVAPEYKYPTPVLQTKEAVQFILNDHAQYFIDESKLFFAGDSAGAQIASQFVLTQTNQEYSKNTNMEKFIPIDSILGMLLYCGPFEPAKLASGDNFLFSFMFNQIGWSYFDKKDWTVSQEVTEASIPANVNQLFPPTYITDGNTASFEPMAHELSTKLKSFDIYVKERYYDIDKVVTKHEYQFIMDNEPGQTTYKDTINFLREILEKHSN